MILAWVLSQANQHYTSNSEWKFKQMNEKKFTREEDRVNRKGKQKGHRK